MRRTRRAALALVALAALAGCAPTPPSERLLDALPEATGAPGERGPYAVDVERRSLAPAAAGAVDADVFLPREGPETGPFPTAIVLQGGAVPVERYRWLGAHLASRGVVVAAPTHPFDLAFFALDHGPRALAGLRAASDDANDTLAGLVGTAALLCGHSLGGVAASKAFLDEPAFASLALLASYPAEGDDLRGRPGRVLSIVGSADHKTTVDEAVAGAEAFDDAEVVVIDDLTHYQWTDGATEGEIAGDAPPTQPDDEVRRPALSFLDALVDEGAGRAPWPFADMASWPVGSRGP